MLESELTVFDQIVRISQVVTPFMLIVLSTVGSAMFWYIKNGIEKAQRAEEAIRDDRLETYYAILEPLIILFAVEDEVSREPGAPKKPKNELAFEIVTSLKYREAGFNLSLFASDDVVRAYNAMMQMAYESANTSTSGSADYRPTDARQMLDAFGSLLLEIRKSVGNDGTSLANLEMLEWMIKDIEKYRD